MKTSVEGTVTSVHACWVDIDIYINKTRHNISVPVDVCPFDAYSGMPITLRKKEDEELGFEVVARRPEPLTEEEKEFLDSINFSKHGE